MKKLWINGIWSNIFQEVSEPAAEALINLSLNSNLAAKMVEMGMIKAAMDVLYKPDSSITRLLVMLLVNLTQLDSGIVSLLQVHFRRFILDYIPWYWKLMVVDMFLHYTFLRCECNGFVSHDLPYQK